MPKLPNVAIRRGLLLLKTFPEVVPGTSFRESMLGKRPSELSHVENLPQRVPVVLAAALIAARGDRTRRRDPRPPQASEPSPPVRSGCALAYGLGAAVLGGITLIVGRLGWLDPWFIRIGLAVLASCRSSGSACGLIRKDIEAARGASRRPNAPARSARLALRPADRAVRPGHAARLDAAGDRLRRPGVSPPGAEGILPGRADRVPAPQCLHEHAVRRGDAPPAGHVGDGRLVVGRPLRPTPRRPLRSRRRP